MSRRRRDKDNISDNATSDSDTNSDDVKDDTIAGGGTGRLVYSTEKKGNNPPKSKADNSTKPAATQQKRVDVDPTLVPKGSFFLHDDRDGRRQKSGEKSDKLRKFAKTPASRPHNLDEVEWKHDKYEELVAKERKLPMKKKENRGDKVPSREPLHEKGRPSFHQPITTTNTTVNGFPTRAKNPEKTPRLNPSAEVFQPKIVNPHENSVSEDNSQNSREKSQFKKYDVYPNYPVSINYLGYQIAGNGLPLSGEDYSLYTVPTHNPAEHYPIYDPSLMYVTNTSSDMAGNAVWYNPDLHGGSIYFQQTSQPVVPFDASEMNEVDELSNYQETS